MVDRKGIARASPLLVLIFLAVLLPTYNLLTMVLRSQSKEAADRESADGSALRADPTEPKRSGGRRRPFHIAMTAYDDPYSQWQCRIYNYWYKKMKDMEGSEMGGLTRVLHSGRPDSLMDEIPTFVVEFLPNNMDQGYVVLNRMWALVQWLEKATIEEDYILVTEPDHIIVNPLPNLAYGSYPAAFPFQYLRPSYNKRILRKFYPEEKGPITDVDPIGGSPVIIQKSQLEELAATWLNVALKMKADPETDKALGWFLDMYAYGVASALHGVLHILRKDFMIHPPWDLEVGKAFIIHYCYAFDYTLKGELTYGKIGEWHFDKRSYLDRPPPKNISLPPPGVPESVVTFVKMVNEATSNIPNWEMEDNHVIQKTMQI